jgi:hypothetical protein
MRRHRRDGGFCPLFLLPLRPLIPLSPVFGAEILSFALVGLDHPILHASSRSRRPCPLLRCRMTVDAKNLKLLIEGDLARVHDTRVVSHIRAMLLEPYAIMRNWDYGPQGQQYLCWMVLEDKVTGAEVGYCDEGFGLKCPWGLVNSGVDDSDKSMGMDSGWFPNFIDVYFESSACTTLPIWRVFRTEPDGTKAPFTAEGGWDATWREVMQLRASDPTHRYDCDHAISYGQPVPPSNS